MRLIKSLTTIVTTISLFVSSLFPVVGLAQGQNPAQASGMARGTAQGAGGANVGGHWVNQVNGLISGFGQMYIKNTQEMQTQALAAQQMQSLSPRAIPSKFFPNCPMPQPVANFPKGVCEPITDIPGGVAQMNQAASYKALAYTYEGFFNQLGSVAQNTRTPVGLQCIEDNAKYVQASLRDRQNALQAIIDNIKKQAQAFRDATNGDLDAMYDLNAELNGFETVNGSSRQGTSQAQKDRDFLKYFGEGCHNIIGTDKILAAKERGGLIQIKDQFQKPHIDAQNFAANSPHHEKELNQTIQKIKADIDRYGVGPFLNGSSNMSEADRKKFAALEELVGQKGGNFSRDIETIRKKIKKINGFELPDIDKDFEQNFDRFRNNLAQADKAKYVNDCITLNNEGLGLDKKDVLRLLKIQGLGNTGNSLDYYKSNLEQILASGDSAEEKLKQIQAINGQGVTITYDNDGKQVVTTPYDYYRKIYTACQASYTHDSSMGVAATDINANMGASNSRADNIATVQKYLDEARGLQRNFKEELVNALYDRVMNCDGKGIETSTCNSTNDALFNTSKGGFCLSHAKTCSDEIAACFNQAQARVEEKKNALEEKRQQYNAKVAQFVNRQDAILKNLQAQVNADSEYIKRFFPGSDYSFQSDMFMGLPQESMSDFGVMLRAGNEEDMKRMLEELPDKVSKLKTQLGDQSVKVGEQISEYINAQRGALIEEQEKWKELGKTCQTTETKFRVDVATFNKAQMEAQAKQDAEVGKFCRRFNNLRGSTNPNGACGGSNSPEKLAEAMDGIYARISNQAEHRIGQYAALCSQTQGERNDDSEDEGGWKRRQEKPEDIIDRLCDGDDGNGKNFLDYALRGLSGDDRATAQDFANAKNGATSLPDSLKGTPAASILRSLNSFNNQNTDRERKVASADEALAARVQAVNKALLNVLREYGVPDTSFNSDGTLKPPLQCPALTRSDRRSRPTAPSVLPSTASAEDKVAYERKLEAHKTEVEQWENKIACDRIKRWLGDKGTLSKDDTRALRQINEFIKPPSSTPNIDDFLRAELRENQELEHNPNSETPSSNHNSAQQKFCNSLYAKSLSQDAISNRAAQECLKETDNHKRIYCEQGERSRLEDKGDKLAKAGQNIARNIASIDREKQNERFSQLGEEAADEPCEATANFSRKGGGFGDFLQNFDANVLGNANGLNGVMR